ncbi:MAG TPA: hemolysin family protein [Gemmatimonadota bacterium]|nr:hemolysin family protein [Gemmatimonadota bacterium]
MAIVLGIVGGLAVSAFFAACEGAFFQLSSPDDGEPPERGSAAARTAKLLEHPERLQGAIELGHMLGVIWVTALAWFLARRFLVGYPAPLTWTVVVLAIAFVVVVVAELAPKALGMQGGVAWASRAGPVVLAWRTLLTPVVAVAAAIGRVAERILPPVPQPSLDSEDIRTMVAETTERSELESGEREMISSIFAFGETTVREVMTPRTDLVAVEASKPLSEIVAIVRESERSRVPVYRETLDEIIGVVYAKDLLAITHGLAEPPIRLPEILWDATFVPEAKKIDDLLRQFQHEQIHMAVVIDEYGGTAGIVTLEDILEELVGEIQDEYDVEEPLVVPLEDGVLRLDGRLDADDFNDFTGSGIGAEDIETIGGLVARELARVARHGDTVEIGDWIFEVEAVEGKRITRLLAWPREESAEDGGGA